MRAILSMLLLALPALPALMTAPLQAQQPPPDRAAVQARVQAVREREKAALAVFLDRQRPRAERVEAGQRLGRVSDRADAAALAAVLKDRGEDDAVRALALDALPGRATPDVVEETLAVVNDPANGGEVLKETAVARLQVLLQFTTAGADREPEIVEALRRAARSDLPAVREAAVGFLALRNDPVAVKVLEDSLARPQGAPFAKADAISFLAANDPREHFAAIRPHLKDGEARTRVAAVQALGADPVSRPQIVALTAARTEDPKVREAALQSLSANDKEFPVYASRLVADGREDPHLRSIAVLELNKVLNRETAPPEQAKQIRATLRTLVLDAARQPQEVRAVAFESLSVHDRDFPALARQLAADPNDPLRQRALRALEAAQQAPPRQP